VLMHNDASLGGIFVGKRHSEGGIDGVNVNTNQPIEVETEEVQIIPEAVNSDEKREFEGKMLTNKEILSILNKRGGGVAFKRGGNVENEYKTANNKVENGAGEPIIYHGGEVILTRGAVSNPEKYSFEGKEMTTREIASNINEGAGGVSFAKGGINECACSFEEGGMLEQTLHRIANTKVKFKVD